MNKPLVSFAITVKDEFEEFFTLVSFLRRHLVNAPYTFEIVVLVDGRPGGLVAEGSLEWVSHRIVYDRFGGDFAAWKNKLSRLCDGEYIFQIDADELPPERVLLDLGVILKAYPVDLIYVPRLNVVKGMTLDDCVRYGWRSQFVPGVESAVIQFPDVQGRIYRNDPAVRWTRPVHEVIEGFRAYAHLPRTAQYSILHVKTIERQREQNSRYSLLMGPGGARS